MPFTQVTLVNDSDSEAVARVHVNPVGGAEAWVDLVVPPKSAAIEQKVPGAIDIVHGMMPTRRGAPTVVKLEGGPHVGTRVLPNDIHVQAQEEFESVTIVVHIDGDSILHANIIDPGSGNMRVESRALLPV